MVISSRQHIEKEGAPQGAGAGILEPSKIGACTPYDPVTFCYTSLSL
jgi:hypothetical protein